MVLWIILSALLIFSVLFYLYNFIRPLFKYKVNCWFCNMDTWVHHPYVNSFVCPNCQQYNGFREDGDYNCCISSQFYAPEQPKRYCTTTSPDLLNSSRGHVNGLCERCNKNQQIIVERLNKFEAIDEENYFDELETYKYRLNKAYPLCRRCETYTAKKLLDVQAKFSTPKRSVKSTKTFSTKTFSIGGKTASIVGSVKRSISGSIFGDEHVSHVSSTKLKQHNHTGKRLFASGFITNCVNSANLGLAILMFLAGIEKLQANAEFSFLDVEKWLPHSVLGVLPLAQENLCSLALLAFLMHAYGVNRSKSRFTFNDLLAYPSWLVLVILSWKPEPSQDILLCQFGMISFLTIITVALVLLPKKRKHRKRPNTIFSAFSTASTPASQCSSIISRHRSPIFQHENSIATWLDKTGTTDNMSSRESTPSRELGKKLIGLTLNGEDEESNGRSMISPSAVSPSRVPKRQGPFSSLTFNTFAQKRLNSGLPTKTSSTSSAFSVSTTTSGGSLLEFGLN